MTTSLSPVGSEPMAKLPPVGGDFWGCEALRSAFEQPVARLGLLVGLEDLGLDRHHRSPEAGGAAEHAGVGDHGYALPVVAVAEAGKALDPFGDLGDVAAAKA